MSLLLLLAADQTTISDTDQAFLDKVGTILRQRTIKKRSGGEELGTFNDETRPVGLQVLELRDDQAREDLEADLGDLDLLIVELPALADDIESLLVLGTALQVELTYFAGDVSANRSPYPQLLERYDKRVKATLAKITRLRDGQPEVAQAATAPVYRFPTAPRDECDEPSWRW